MAFSETVLLTEQYNIILELKKQILSCLLVGGLTSNYILNQHFYVIVFAALLPFVPVCHYFQGAFR